jgi:hypothetical protein
LSAPLDSISEDSLTKTVKDVLENPKYEWWLFKMLDITIWQFQFQVQIHRPKVI